MNSLNYALMVVDYRFPSLFIDMVEDILHVFCHHGCRSVSLLVKDILHQCFRVVSNPSPMFQLGK